MPESVHIEKVVEGVLKNPGYRCIDLSLVQNIAESELAKGRSIKDAVKQTRSKLHQVGGAYQEKTIPYPSMIENLQKLPHDKNAPESMAFSRQAMSYHRSTEERLAIIEELFATVFAKLPPIHRVLDLACGLNPLALPWMLLPDMAEYWAFDIYTDMLVFLQLYFTHMNIPGKTAVCDLTRQLPEQRADLAILFKTIPCLEQIEKNIGKHVLENINASNILVSYPAKSLGGHHKGMPDFYASQFQQLCEGKNWKIQEWRFASELVFLIEK